MAFKSMRKECMPCTALRSSSLLPDAYKIRNDNKVNFSPLYAIQGEDEHGQGTNSISAQQKRRQFLSTAVGGMAVLWTGIPIDADKSGQQPGLRWLNAMQLPSAAASAEEVPNQVTEEELNGYYENPAIPPAPEERSGLVVLRVAEVAQFQEKILRAVASGELEGLTVAPMQFVFGTKILLKNSNLDGNMKLMIYQEIPRKRRKDAIQNAVRCMNELQDIITYTSAIQRDFEVEEMIQLANMYLSVRVNLNQLYEYLPDREKDKYYGYFAAVTEYEKKIADGVYNPEIDGVLKFD